MSQFETLPNEVLFDILEFLSSTDLLRGFLNLNSRLNQSLYTHFRNHQFNLQSISKQHFDIICQEHLPILSNNITSLYLSNDDETPNLCELLLSSGFTFDRFIRLKSLSLSHIASINTINQIILQCRSLPYLQKLYLIDCQIQKQRTNAAGMINNIWSLSNLRHCVMNDIAVNMTWIYEISVISSTLEYLSMKMIEGDQSALYYLCKSAPHLQRLNIDVIRWSFLDQSKIIFSSLISLKTCFQGLAHLTLEFLKSLPNLSSLTLEVSNISMNGYDWQTFLLNYLPKLKIFRLKMSFTFSNYANMIPSIDQLVDSFRTAFWIEEHQWYVRCDCYLLGNIHIGVLYTLPDAFNQCSYLNTYYSLSTQSDGDELYSHHHVHFVNQQYIQINSFQDLKLFNIRFPNIHHLEIVLPLMAYSDFLYNLSFNQLTSITVVLNDVAIYDQLQTFLNQTHVLYSLKLNSFGGSLEGLFQLTSSSIRRLDLLVAQLQHGLFFNHENCMNLINSPLGRQCEVLVIGLESRNDILYLIEKMPHLRVLTFRLKDDNSFNYRIFQSTHQKLMRWLEKNLSPRCSINIDSNQESKICIWMSRETNRPFLLNNETVISNNRLHVREYLYVFLFFSCFLFILLIQKPCVSH